MNTDSKKQIPTLSPKSIIAELKSVTWPTREQATRLTMVIIIICLIVGAYIGIIDALLAKVLEILTKR